MGLDMYLYRREYVSGHSFNAASELSTFHALVYAVGIQPTEHAPHIHIEVCVAYWRMANAIHGYIIQNHAGGVDECQNIYLTLQDLKTLRDKCESVLLAPATAVEYAAKENGLMPTAGFFFGSYDIDEWYMEDMKNTVNQLDSIIESTPEDSWTDFIYRASW